MTDITNWTPAVDLGTVPTQQLRDELESRFDLGLSQYPAKAPGHPADGGVS